MEQHIVTVGPLLVPFPVNVPGVGTFNIEMDVTASVGVTRHLEQYGRHTEWDCEAEILDVSLQLPDSSDRSIDWNKLDPVVIADILERAVDYVA